MRQPNARQTAKLVVITQHLSTYASAIPSNFRHNETGSQTPPKPIRAMWMNPATRDVPVSQIWTAEARSFRCMKARLHVGATHVRMATQSPQIVFTGALMLPLLRDKGSAAYLARNIPRSKGSVTGQLDLAAMYHVHARHTYGRQFGRYAAEDRVVHWLQQRKSELTMAATEEAAGLDASSLLMNYIQANSS